MMVIEPMSPPPPGAFQLPSLGDAPINADDYPTNPDTVYVCCVLTGNWPGEFKAARKVVPDLGAHYVRSLYEQVTRWAPRNVPWRFLCFTDRPEIPGVTCRPLLPGVYSYFNKLQLFRDSAFPSGSRVIFFDLDTWIVGDWSPLAQVALDRPVFLRNEWDGKSLPATGVMIWRAGDLLTTRLWDSFAPQAQDRPPYKPVLGDGLLIRTEEEWIHQWVVPFGEWQAWQNFLPGHFSSAKRDATMGKTVVYFHGRPRPHEVPGAPQYVRV